MMETKTGYKAIAKYLMIAPTKVRPLANLVRGKAYPEAVAILEAMPHKGARLLLKVLKSSGANALNSNRKLDEDSLVVATILVDEGPRLKRVWARSHGKRDILLKRMSHITVYVDEKVKVGK